MKKLVFLTYNAEKKTLTTVDNMANLVGAEYSIINIPHQNLTPEIKESIILSLGSISTRLAKQYIDDHKVGKVRVIQLPSLSQLQKSSKNIETRKNTQKILEELKVELEKDRPEITEIKVKKEDIKDITIDQIISASNKLQNTTFHHTQDGELIEIGPEGLQNTTDEIYITYEELLIIKRIQETLGTVETTIKRRRNGKGADR